MKRNTHVDLRADRGATIQGLQVDLSTVYESRKVPKSSVDVVYNQLSDLSKIGFRVNDQFDLLMIARGYSTLTANSGTGSSQLDGSEEVPNKT